jgi:hypothetical protein
MTNTESRETHLVLTAMGGRKTMDEIARWVGDDGVNPASLNGQSSAGHDLLHV